MIKKHDNQANILAWQGFLNTQGEALRADGRWGPLTKAATGRFQMKHSLTPDGIVGEDTLSVAMQNGFEGFAAPIKPISRKALICISAGHTNTAGRDQGVAANGLIEGREAVKIRDRVADLVRQKGFAVIEDGADGVNDPLSKALDLVPLAKFAIEFHFNAGPPTATGIEVLSLPNNRPRSQDIAGALASSLGLRLRGANGWKSDTEGQHSRLAFCRAGGLVVETCFLTNTGDVAAYQANFEKMCVALADAIERCV